MKETSEEGLKLNQEWSKTWSGDGKFVQVVGGMSADHGDDPRVTHPKVRGHVAELGPSDDTLVVDWDEDNDCGSHQYGVATRGLSRDETVKIANSLEEPSSDSSDY